MFKASILCDILFLVNPKGFEDLGCSFKTTCSKPHCLDLYHLLCKSPSSSSLQCGCLLHVLWCCGKFPNSSSPRCCLLLSFCLGFLILAFLTCSSLGYPSHNERMRLGDSLYSVKTWQSSRQGMTGLHVACLYVQTHSHWTLIKACGWSIRCATVWCMIYRWFMHNFIYFAICKTNLCWTLLFPYFYMWLNVYTIK